MGSPVNESGWPITLAENHPEVAAAAPYFPQSDVSMPHPAAQSKQIEPCATKAARRRRARAAPPT
jgi:hypothetical protein